MADLGITTPLLSSQPSDQVILTVHDDAESASEPVPQPGHEQRSPSQFHNRNNNRNNRNSYLISRNPFRFMGCEELNVPPPTTVDPFRNNTFTIEGVYEWLKIVVCIPVALVRLVLFGICLLVGYIVTKLALEGWKDKQNPMPRWRCRLMWVTRICARCILFSFGYHWIKRKGKPAPREIAPIIVSNHVSYIEPIFYFYELFPTIVAAESHDSIPFVGTIIRAMQVIYVNRFIPSSRKQAIKEIKRRASCDRFPRVLLFPEGTTTNGKNLISFQLGAFIPGYPIQPVIVRYPHVHFDNSWGHISLARLMFRMFTQFHNFFEVEYLPVILPLDKETAVHFAQRAAVTLSYPSDEPIKGKEYVTICWHDTLSFCICAPFALKTSHAIATALNTTQTGHSYGDVILHTQAHEAKQVKPSIYMIEMAKVESLFRISSAEALEFLDKFLSMSPDPSGRVQFHDFSRVLGLKACPLSEEIFAFIDMEKSGTITFRQFLYGSAYVMKQPSFRQACELAFSKCSAAVKDYIVEQELWDSIQLAIPFLKEDEVHDLFILFDNDNDGRVSKDDFLSCLKRNPLLIALFNPQLQHQDLLAGNQAVDEIV